MLLQIIELETQKIVLDELVVCLPSLFDKYLIGFDGIRHFYINQLIDKNAIFVI